MSATITIPLDPVTRKRLSELSKHRDCTEAELAELVLREYTDLHTWQIQAIDEGIEAANRGRMTDHDDLKSFWEARLGNKVD